MATDPTAAATRTIVRRARRVGRCTGDVAIVPTSVARLAVGGRAVAGRDDGRPECHLPPTSAHPSRDFPAPARRPAARVGVPQAPLPSPPVLRMTREAHTRLVAHAYDGLPDEACGLLAGPPGAGKATRFYPCRNAARSSRVYTLDHRDYMAAEDDADARGDVIVGVVHSHTHTDAFPSPTDVERAVDPGWHYVIVSLRDEAPVTRSFRIADGRIMEEAIAVEAR
jgi:proteasome lid subunit RPN8/RPN11